MLGMACPAGPSSCTSRTWRVCSSLCTSENFCFSAAFLSDGRLNVAAFYTRGNWTHVCLCVCCDDTTFDFPLVFAGRDAWKAVGVFVEVEPREETLLGFMRLTEGTLQLLDAVPPRGFFTTEQVRFLPIIGLSCSRFVCSNFKRLASAW